MTAAGLCLIFLALVVALNNRNQVVGLNQEIEYNDFGISVQKARKTSSLGSGVNKREALGVYCVVTVKVANHAEAVDSVFNNETLILIDVDGRQYHISAEGQDALESEAGYTDPCSTPILAGKECVTEVVFDIGASVSDLRMKISDGTPLGDIIDVIHKKRIKIDL